MSINFLAVGVCTVINMVLGMLWYGPLFGGPWKKHMNMKPDHMKDPKHARNARNSMIAAMVSYFTMAVVISYAVRGMGATTASEGVKIAWIGWLGFSVTTMLPNTFFSSYENPLPLAMINLGYPFVGMTIMGAILTVWV